MAKDSNREVDPPRCDDECSDGRPDPDAVQAG